MTDSITARVKRNVRVFITAAAILTVGVASIYIHSERTKMRGQLYELQSLVNTSDSIRRLNDSLARLRDSLYSVNTRREALITRSRQFQERGIEFYIKALNYGRKYDSTRKVIYWDSAVRSLDSGKYYTIISQRINNQAKKIK